MQNPAPQSQQGFSLIELILYLGIASIIITAVMIFVGTLIEGRAKHNTIAEVELQGMLVLQRITQSIRNADAIISPTAGSSAAQLSLTVSDALLSPTTYATSSSQLTLTEGINSPIVLTSPSVNFQNILFTNLSRPETPGTIRVEFTLGYANASGLTEYDYTRTFVSTVSLR